MSHFDKTVCCRESTEGFLDSHFDGNNFEQKSVATDVIIFILLGASLPLSTVKRRFQRHKSLKT